MNAELIQDYFKGNYQTFYSKYLTKVKKIGGNEYQAPCPFHEKMKKGRSQPLSIVVLKNFSQRRESKMTKKIAKSLLPYVATIITRLPYRQKLSLILDRLLVLAEAA